MNKTIIIIIFWSFSLLVVGQNDTIKENKHKLTILVGVCATLNLDKAPPPSSLPSEKIPTCYFGPALSVYYSKIKSKHYMFQTGLEYAYAKYYVSNYFDALGKYSDHYSSMKFVIQTITIPAYFNLLLSNKTLYLGIGPTLDIYPYATGSGYKIGSDIEKVENERFKTHIFDVGASAKIGKKYKLGKGALTFELRIKSGIRSALFSYGTSIVNQYCSLSTGYTF